jgi:bacterioferritin-associated ferredoxin
MLVCHCKNKTDRDVRAALAEGARTCDDIASRCEAGSACGGCRSAIRNLLGGLPRNTRSADSHRKR